ncbi:MAG: hypothetical protein UHM08_04470 [Bacteroidales bacterium]|nr:hypothetical protein [Bacteroidales bacterium]
MNEHLIVEVNDKLNFKKVTCKEGHYITNWNKENVLDYTSAKTMYCPMNTDLEAFYCVSEEEHNEIMEKQIKAAEELHNKEK